MAKRGEILFPGGYHPTSLCRAGRKAQEYRLPPVVVWVQVKGLYLALCPIEGPPSAHRAKGANARPEQKVLLPKGVLKPKRIQSAG